MSQILGWLAAISVIYMLCALGGGVNMMLDAQALIVIFTLIYGLTLVIYGFSNTVNSITGIKYLFNENLSSNSELSHIYKTQIKLSMIAATIYLLIGFVAIGHNIVEINTLQLMQSFSVTTLSLVYALLLSGLIYYPLYKKLA